MASCPCTRPQDRSPLLHDRNKVRSDQNSLGKIDLETPRCRHHLQFFLRSQLTRHAFFWKNFHCKNYRAGFMKIWLLLQANSKAEQVSWSLFGRADVKAFVNSRRKTLKRIMEQGSELNSFKELKDQSFGKLLTHKFKVCYFRYTSKIKGVMGGKSQSESDFGRVNKE